MLIMEANLSTTNPINAGTITAVAATKIVCLPFLLVTFIFGLVINTFYLWILCFKMRRNLNVIWFSHLLLCNLIFILVLPFLAVMYLFHPLWVLGEFMCKLVNFLLSFSMYGAAFFLTVISVDRYWLVFHPHFYRKHMHAQQSSIVCLLLWGLALFFSSPYLAFRRVHQEKNISICYNDYTLTGKPDIELEAKVKWFMLYFRLLGGFLIPLVIISICYLKIAFKIKKENFAKSKKPYKIIAIAIISFFISWAPYHVWYGMSIEKGLFQESTLQALKVFATILACFNACFTPILYLLIVEKFKAIFKKSVMSVFQTALIEAFPKSTDNRFELNSISVRKCEENTF
ncbi:probable G-protein coupled receptor 33 [Bufo gargarizans]|uniref:probable G-protein coupled receptor 33 n=1 Tax=Bufo gargarizans TaxID=30331 RepID=UPI001CF44A1F|nr:probable G-protein coupled receptor 33 [Bufo gargarizans]XP_044134122.1 probable G-protein coupled receptor 33 [Bufo gargarizans]